MRTLDEKAVEALKNPALFEAFIKEQEGFILKCASKYSGKYITKSDDEWAVALAAFSQAMRDYAFAKGSFFAFAELVIQRKLIDHLRSRSRSSIEISVNPDVFSGEADPDGNTPPIEMEIFEKIRTAPDPSLRDEITAMSARLSQYGFSFYDLIRCSPKAEKTRLACASAIRFLLENPAVLSEMGGTKNLPIKIIEKNTNLPRKILERHRKYIIAATEILAGDYPGLAAYLRFVGREKGK